MSIFIVSLNQGILVLNQSWNPSTIIESNDCSVSGNNGQCIRASGVASRYLDKE